MAGFAPATSQFNRPGALLLSYIAVHIYCGRFDFSRTAVRATPYESSRDSGSIVTTSHGLTVWLIRPDAIPIFSQCLSSGCVLVAGCERRAVSESPGVGLYFVVAVGVEPTLIRAVRVH